MLAHSLKHILEYVPEALPLIKKANLEEEFPTNNIEGAIASALHMKFLEKIAHTSFDVFARDRVEAAVQMYGVKDQVEALGNLMVKAAQAKQLADYENSDENYLLKVSSFEGTLGDTPVDLRSGVATSLYKEAKERNLEPSDLVTLYSGNGYLSKEAAVKSLANRFHTTKNDMFVKLAHSINTAPDHALTPEILVTIADSISTMDKQAGLNFKGHNFYKEAFFVKEAAFKGSLSVTLAGKQIPYESIERVGKSNISQYIGADIAKEMDSGALNFKSVVETLPLDLQRVLLNLTKNV